MAAPHRQFDNIDEVLVAAILVDEFSFRDEMFTSLDADEALTIAKRLLSALSGGDCQQSIDQILSELYVTARSEGEHLRNHLQCKPKTRHEAP